MTFENRAKGGVRQLEFVRLAQAMHRIPSFPVKRIIDRISSKMSKSETKHPCYEPFYDLISCMKQFRTTFEKRCSYQQKMYDRCTGTHVEFKRQPRASLQGSTDYLGIVEGTGGPSSIVDVGAAVEIDVSKR